MDLWAVGQVLLLSAAPVAELRGGLPLALALGFPPLPAYVLAVVGNLAPAPLLLLGLGRALPALRQVPGRLGKLVSRYLAWQERRGQGWFSRWGPWALFVLVAVPLPFTGAWTGCVVAAVLGVRVRSALPPIAAGVLLAGVLVLLASLGVLSLL